MIARLGIGWIGAVAMLLGLSAGQAAAQGQMQPVSGELAASESIRDTVFGPAARALGLRRTVEMWQWQEVRDTEGERSYRPIWAERPIDSRDFAGDGSHVNPDMPFASAQWWSSTALLGGLPVAPDLLAGLDGWQPLPADESLLPENLAVVFRADDGLLISGNDPLAPEIGDLRVRWQLLPAGPVHGEAQLIDGVLHVGSGGGLVRGLAEGGALPGLAQGARPGSDLLLWVAGAAALALVVLLLSWGRGRKRRARRR